MFTIDDSVLSYNDVSTCNVIGGGSGSHFLWNENVGCQCRGLLQQGEMDESGFLRSEVIVIILICVALVF